jgi:methylated-DNA-[protein]-cysteine S-methyltransferase
MTPEPTDPKEKQVQLTFRIIATRAGYVGIVASPRGLRRVLLPERTATAARRAIQAEFADAVEDEALLPRLAAALQRYFAGRAVRFDVPLDWDGAGEFERAAWAACGQLPYGQTVSYKDLAARLGKPGAARAIGRAMSRNPLPIVVPCHRVLKSDGGLGGYSGPGGVAFKRRLLEMETAAIP